ncbi:Membrane proteinase PrsW, cleaves anti-sigma factor RsiW, M82 family [Desulfatibacillum alkenivorans DSM 16219]|jgi:RsiW-degrading membrane proteinase PrsW (M82 family)|uniref:Membrane proteinase PrsW, cleaves anti-sigma factor RsiW, M82 family n=1 Tax=Desulfatibacillum alkenivorans DSM 16219 TaxID=1121393 RepID=A0A1M6CN87_9BACT|nr:PrsW family intramembrane metalloprotease [Desulfatibacillum alkenivorans]SHI62383.1 Membrane proteinase PrsW, cleaves anti-sigma factor RsiW, M82 family [Desulfatibacillum alkenivorans DSM 16219]
MPYHYILIALSTVVGLLFIARLRKYELHEKEPWRYLIAVTAWGGGVSIALASLLYVLVASWGVEISLQSIHGPLIVGLVEEFAKLAAFCSGLWFFYKKMNEPVDGLVYMCCIALGFSLVENYAYSARTGLAVFHIRSILCTPMHMLFSVPMGLGVYTALRHGAGLKMLSAAFAYAVLTHAAYDWLVSNYPNLFVMAIMIGACYALTMMLVEYTTANSPFRISLEEAVRMAKPIPQKGVKCPACLNEADKPEYKIGRISLHQCPSCGRFITKEKNLPLIQRFFGSVFKSRQKTREDIERAKRFKALFTKNQRTKMLAFELQPMNAHLETLNREMCARVEAKWWYPKESRLSESFVQPQPACAPKADAKANPSTQIIAEKESCAPVPFTAEAPPSSPDPELGNAPSAVDYPKEDVCWLERETVLPEAELKRVEQRAFGLLEEQKIEQTSADLENDGVVIWGRRRSDIGFVSGLLPSQTAMAADRESGAAIRIAIKEHEDGVHVKISTAPLSVEYNDNVEKCSADAAELSADPSESKLINDALAFSLFKAFKTPPIFSPLGPFEGVGVKEILFYLIINPFDIFERKKKLHTPPEKGGRFIVSAFIFPEYWFLWNELWGGTAVSLAADIIMLRQLIYCWEPFPLRVFALCAFFGVRLLWGVKGAKMYYAYHGKWPPRPLP